MAARSIAFLRLPRIHSGLNSTVSTCSSQNMILTRTHGTHIVILSIAIERRKNKNKHLMKMKKNVNKYV